VPTSMSFLTLDSKDQARLAGIDIIIDDF